MKFTVTMKDPDTLTDAIEEAVREEVEAMGLPEDEAEALMEARADKVGRLCDRWFEYGEYLQVEIDTEAETATVVPLKS